MVNYRYLGNSGLKVSEISYGNWVTHASQIDDSAAIATVHAALDAGITTFDTADTYANTAAEVVLGKALSGQRREGLELFTKVYWPVGPKGPNDAGLSRSGYDASMLEMSSSDPRSQLQELVQTALQRSRPIGVARLLAEAAQADLEETQASRLPQVSLSVPA